MKLAAINDKMILRKVEDEDQTVGKIFIPDLGKDLADTYEVLDIRKEIFNPVSGRTYTPDAKIGDKVIIKKAFVYEVKLNGDTFNVASIAEVLAIIKED